MPHHTAYIRNGKIHPDTPRAQYLAEILAQIPDGPVLITTEPLPRKRSGPFNRYYHGTVLSHLLHALNDAGNDVAVSDHNRKIVHEELRDGPLYPDPVAGKKNSTARLTDQQFQRFVRDVVSVTDYCLGYAIPAPPVYWETVDD